MIRLFSRLVRMGGVAALLLYLACDVTTPDRMVRPPVIRDYRPRTTTLSGLVGIDTLSFSVRAIDPDDAPLDFWFTMADSVVERGTSWTYLVHDTGDVDVTAHVGNSGATSTVHWRVRRTEPENQPPVLVTVSPTDPNPSVIIGESIEFVVTAEDPEGLPLTYVYTVNDTVVTTSRRLVYHSWYVGDIDVKVVVTDGELFAIHTWLLSVLAEPDSILPAPVPLVTLVTGEEPGELVAEWIAVGDDGMQGRASEYLVRTSAVTIDNETRWSQSSERLGAPAPAAPGTLQRMVIQDLNPANLIQVAVRARDDFGNLSPLVESEGAWSKGMEVTGTVRDAFTNEPLAGIPVRITGFVDTTDANGLYEWRELPNLLARIQIEDETVVGDIGAYYDLRSPLYQVTHNDVKDYWLIPNIPVHHDGYPSFLWFFKLMAEIPGTQKHWLNTWNLPIQVWVRPFEANGLDYASVIRDAFLIWESATGMTFFEFVDEEPEFGVHIDYRSGITRDYYEILERGVRSLPIKSRIVFRTHFTPASSSLDLFQRIASHEVGHVLGMQHSYDETHLMIGGRSPPVRIPTPEEVLVVRAMYHLPRGISLEHYLSE